jgi:hypothetical protein
MGVDRAVCFTKAILPVEQLSSLIDLPEAGEVYIVSSRSSEKAPGLFFFTLFSNTDIDLEGICKAISVDASPVCLAWKAEHGGCGGYITFQEGAEVENVFRLGDDYLLLPKRGVETCFGIELPMDAMEAILFPEIIIDDAADCFFIDHANRSGMPLPTSLIDQLCEQALDVEPVLPLNL